MPFIDDDLLWCPDNDGRMVDLSCLVSKLVQSIPLDGASMQFVLISIFFTDGIAGAA